MIPSLILSIFTILNMSFNLWEWLLSQPIFLVSLIFIQRSKGTNGKVCLQGMNFHHKSDILEPRFWEETEWCSGQSHKNWRSGNSGPLPSIVQIWPSIHINSSILNLSMSKMWLGELGEENMELSYTVFKILLKCKMLWLSMKWVIQ